MGSTLVDSLGVELRFPIGISLRTSGGPGFSTTVVVSGSGAEQRTQNRKRSQASWTVSSAEVGANFEQFIDFFYLACGKTYDFRIKDHTDYSADFTRGVVGLGVGTGAPTLQLGKKYGYGGAFIVRPVYKPVPGTLAVKKNGTLLTEGSSSGNWEVDLSKGLIVFTETVSKTITGISQAANGVITAAGHGYTAGQKIYLGAVGGMTEINGLIATVASPATNTFQTGIDTRLFSAYASGGTAKFFPQPSDVLTASFEFDLPVRFDTDQMTYSVIDRSGADLVITWDAVPLIEVPV